MSITVKRLLGLILGAIVGLAYGLVAELINTVALPGIPLYAPPPGREMMIVLDMLGGGLIGFITMLATDAILGVIAGAVLTGTLSTALTLWVERGSSERMFSLSAILFLTFLPRVVLFAPLSGGFRWVVNLWDTETTYEPFSLRKRVLSPLIMIIGAIGMGYFALKSQVDRDALVHLDSLIKAATRSPNAEMLPASLKPVDGLWGVDHGSYTLNLILDPDVIPAQRPMTGMNVHLPAIIVVFEDGFRFGCVYTPPYTEPSCQDF
jgi:hypothetical protein